MTIDETKDAIAFLREYAEILSIDEQTNDETFRRVRFLAALMEGELVANRICEQKRRSQRELVFASFGVAYYE